MRIRSITLAISLIFLFTLTGGGIGCSEKSDSDDMMKNIPDNIAEYQYFNVKVLRGDEGLEYLYHDLEDMYDDELDLCGISLQDIHYIADCEYIDWGDLTLFKGEFDLDVVRNTLGVSDYIETEYSEEEVWLGDGGDTMIALFENLVVIGDEEDVMECIDVIKGEQDSLLDSSDAKDLMNKLSGDLYIYYDTHRVGEGFGLGGSYEIENYKAFGVSINKKNGDTVSGIMIFEFGDTDEAENTLDEIEEMFEEDSEEVINYKNFDVEQDGRFIVISVQVDIEDMV